MTLTVLDEPDCPQCESPLFVAKAGGSKQRYRCHVCDLCFGNYATPEQSPGGWKHHDIDPDDRQKISGTRKGTIIAYIEHQDGPVRSRDIIDAFEMHTTTASNYLTILWRDGYLKRRLIGKSRNDGYEYRLVDGGDRE